MTFHGGFPRHPGSPAVPHAGSARPDGAVIPDSRPDEKSQLSQKPRRVRLCAGAGSGRRRFQRGARGGRRVFLVFLETLSGSEADPAAAQFSWRFEAQLCCRARGESSRKSTRHVERLHHTRHVVVEPGRRCTRRLRACDRDERQYEWEQRKTTVNAHALSCWNALVADARPRRQRAPRPFQRRARGGRRVPLTPQLT